MTPTAGSNRPEPKPSPRRWLVVLIWVLCALGILTVLIIMPEASGVWHILPNFSQSELVNSLSGKIMLAAVFFPIIIGPFVTGIAAVLMFFLLLSRGVSPRRKIATAIAFGLSLVSSIWGLYVGKHIWN